MKSPNKTLNIIIADDHVMFRDGLKTLFKDDNGIKIVAEASNGLELLEKIQNVLFDMIILDLSMPKMNGMEVLKDIRKKNPDKKFIILTMHREFEFFQQALNMKVDGYILKEEASNVLIKAVYDINNGGKYFSSAIFTDMAEESNLDKKFDKLILELLTKREIEIVKLIAEGNSSHEISKKLEISHRTVETHRYRIFEKLRIKKVTDLVKIAIQSKLI